MNPLIPTSIDCVWSGIFLVALVQVAVGIWLLVRARRHWAESVE